MTDRDLTGTRIYNRGDMANLPHFGTIISTKEDGQWGGFVTIKSDAQESEFGEEFSIPSHTYTVPATMINDLDKGNGLTRIVTLAAYEARRAADLAKLQRFVDSRRA